MPKRDLIRRIDQEAPVVVTAAGVIVMPSAVGSYLMADGSVALAGDMDVLAGVTIDGVDISELGLLVEQISGATTIPWTGYTVMSHGSNLADFLPDWSSELKVWDDIFDVNEQVVVSNTAGQLERMRITGAAVADTNIYGEACWNYPVTRRIETNPAGLTVDWAKGTLANGLTFRGYVAFDNRGGSAGSPSMRIIQWLDNPPTATEHVFRAGELSGVLGLGADDFGFAAGRLTSADTYLLFNAATGKLLTRNADLEVWTDQRVFFVQGTSDGAHEPGYAVFGRLSGGHFVVDPGEDRVSIQIGDQEVIYFDATDGSRITGLLGVGDPTGPQIQLGELDNDAVIVARNRFDVAQFMVRARADTGGVYLFAGNPKPQGNWLEFDDGMTVDGTIRARGGIFLGPITFASTGEVIVQDPDDPRRYGRLMPRYLAGYTVDGTDTQHLSSLIAWAPTVLEVQPGSGQWRTWLAGEGFFGDWRYRHFRWERNGRVGLFDGDTPKAYLDSAGNAVLAGSLIWAGGKGVADATGIRHTESEDVFWEVKPNNSVFMLLQSTGSINYNTLRVVEDTGIAGYFSGGYVGLYARSTMDQIGIWGYAATITDEPGVLPNIDALDSDLSDEIESGSGTSIYGLTDGGTAIRGVATDGGRGVVGITNSATLGGVVARNTGGGPALVLENSYMNANSQAIYNVARMQLQQVSAPGGASGAGVLYCEDKSGKMALMVKFPTGAAQQIAIEP